MPGTTSELLVVRPKQGLSAIDVASLRRYIRSNVLQTVGYPDTGLISSGAELAFVGGGHCETRTHAANSSGTFGPLLSLADLSAVYRSSSFQVAAGNEKETEPMFLSWFIALGPFLLLAARKPSLHRSLIIFASCQCLAHAAVMTIQTAEAWKHGVHRDFTDVVLFGVIGGIVLALSLPRPAQHADAATAEA